MRKAMIMAALAALTAFNPACAAKPGGPPAPAFELADLDGRTLSLDRFKDKVLVLNFWATWCPPCRAEIPDFVAVYKEYNAKGLEIIGVSLDQMTEEELAPLARDFGINYPVALVTEKIVRDYQPGQFIPATIVIDKKGRVRKRHVGVMDKDTLESLFLEYNKE